MSLQRENLAEQRRMNDAMLAFYAKQEAALKKQAVSPYRPSAPPPTPATAGSDQARLMMGVDAQRRFGFGDTIRAGLAQYKAVA